jgi:hypothetical protein
VVADLERTRPPVILFANEEWWNRVDGVPVAVTNRPIEEYVLSRYRPWRHEGEHWLWKRAPAPLLRGAAGCVPGAVASTEVAGAGVERVSGRVDGPGRVVYLLSSEGRLAAAGESRPGGGWEIEAPAGEAFPAHAFAYDPGRDALLPLCAGGEEEAGAEVQAERSHG